MKYTFLIIHFIICSLTVFSQDTVFNQTDAKGLKQGIWKKYYPSGKLMYQGNFKDNKPTGEMRRYYDSGVIKALFLYNEKGDYSSATLYYEDGTPASKGYYSNSERDSIWEFYSYYSKKLKSKERYVKGKREGFAYQYFDHGGIAEKIMWKNNMKHGIWEQYFEDGTLRLKSNYTASKLNGDFVVYQGRNNILVKGKYKDNLPEGLWTFYNENGVVSENIKYVNGKPENEAQLTEKQQEYFRKLDKNIGRYSEPVPEDLFPGGGAGRGDY